MSFPPFSNNAIASSSRNTLRADFFPPYSQRQIGVDDGTFDFKRVHETYPEGQAKRPRSAYSLSVWQQPERARLCSYKEENQTIDRRPVDPPPVVEVFAPDPTDQLFVHVSIVHPDPGPQGYEQVKTPTGADASAGEVVQTPERLRGVDGQAGQLCVFAKLSVRMPGIFRLKFTLFRNDERGILEVAHTVSGVFEVFSPKLFKGMRESTPLTRHLAAQGLKVKLRTETGVKPPIDPPIDRPVEYRPVEESLLRSIALDPISSDLSAFSLNNRYPRDSVSSSSSQSFPFSPFSHPSSSTSISSSPLQAIINRAGDDGIPILPPPFRSHPIRSYDLPPIRDI